MKELLDSLLNESCTLMLYTDVFFSTFAHNEQQGIQKAGPVKKRVHPGLSTKNVLPFMLQRAVYAQ